MSSRQSPLPGGVVVHLAAFLGTAVCPRCDRSRDPGEFLKSWTRGADGRVFMRGAVEAGCVSCVPPARAFPLEAGMCIEELLDGAGAPYRWLQRDSKGTFGTPLEMRRMDLLHAGGTRTLRPQPRLVRSKPVRQPEGQGSLL